MLGGRLGTAIEPALKPLGFDYRIGVGILGAFAAREVFVSTLGIVFDLGDEADEEDEGLRATVDWYRENEGWWQSIRSGDYLSWYERNYKQRGVAEHLAS